MVTCAKGKKSTMANLFTTLSRSTTSRPLLQFLEALLLRKAAQTPMLTGKHSESFHSWEWSLSWDGFLCCKFCCSSIAMHSFCLLASMELTLIPNWSLLYLHSNDMNSLKAYSWPKKVIVRNIISRCVIILLLIILMLLMLLMPTLMIMLLW